MFLAPCRNAAGSYAILVFTESGEPVREVALPSRGHDVVLDQAGRQAVAFARRPGTFAIGFDVAGARSPASFACPPDRHFYGHGAFAPDGRLLYSTESDYAHGARGVVGVYDCTDGFRRIGELDSHGIGPHELILMPDGRTLAIANGGIATHPATGREKLNLDTMRSSISFVDRLTGDLLARHETPAEFGRLSMRHMTVDGSEFVWFGGQWEGSPVDVPSVIGRASLDSAVELLPSGPELPLALEGYIGSMARSRDGSVIAASSPKGGRILLIDAATMKILSEERLFDGCGVTGIGNRAFLATSGAGTILPVASDTGPGRPATFPVAFDNHVKAV
ncbi:DUF1513 domain-containing protein [Propylenella binzhouense]|uniref:DUF1513 domain-containing protein n=1 Tax=Propylenella binzhouense TaxID=2555902 RepID=UPI00136E080D